MRSDWTTRGPDVGLIEGSSLSVASTDGGDVVAAGLGLGGGTTSRVGLDAPSLPTASRARTCTTWVLESLNQCRLARGCWVDSTKNPFNQTL